VNISEADVSRPPRFSALRWERGAADRFLEWRTTSGADLDLMGTFGEAVAQTLRQDAGEFAQSGELAARLPAVLECCDQLGFDQLVESFSYAALHVLDRYGRVDQVLQHLISIGRLPLRIGGVRVLEVGAGPAPALYATRDFYAVLRQWPGLGSISVGAMAAFDALDRGRAWDQFVHRLSERLLGVRSDGRADGELAFARAVHDLSGFDVRHRHHHSVARRAARIIREFERDDEWISEAEARQTAYKEGVREPSAYDLVFLCYFVTQEITIQTFEQELRRLASSLTPGGVLIVIGGTSEKYSGLYSRMRGIAARARLKDLSPAEPFQANADSRRLQLVAEHVCANVEFALMKAPSGVRSAVEKNLPRDLVKKSKPFRLPQFRALTFVRTRS
jgi:hypothetical protein